MPEERLPVLKILWGIFAFPSMYPALTLRAAGIPLIGIVATTLFWVGRRVEAIPSLSTWGLLLFNWLLFAWLAVRVHRAVLLGDHDSSSQRVKCVANYLAAIVVAELLFSVCLALVSFRYVPTLNAAQSPDAMIGLPAWVIWVVQLGPLYLLARLSPVLPAFALGHGWQLADAWSRTRGNGWRLFAVVCLLPWIFNQIADLVYTSIESTIVIGVLAVLKALTTLLGIMALSLAYRELMASPEPPPTAPPV